MIDLKKALERANDLYAARKLQQGGRSLEYTAPEMRPEIASESTKCAIEAVVELFNEELAALADKYQRKPEAGSRYVVVYDEE